MLNLEYKGFWLSVKPIRGDIRYICQVVNIANFDYKYNESKGFDLGAFCALNDVDLKNKFHKTVDSLIDLDITYVEFEEHKIQELEQWAKENDYLLSSNTNAERLITSIKNIEDGKNLIEFDPTKD